eukprot:462346-Pyramimonas_sp.AAC.1
MDACARAGDREAAFALRDRMRTAGHSEDAFTGAPPDPTMSLRSFVPLSNATSRHSHTQTLT